MFQCQNYNEKHQVQEMIELVGDQERTIHVLNLCNIGQKGRTIVQCFKGIHIR